MYLCYSDGVPLLMYIKLENCSPPLSRSNCLGCNHYDLVPVIVLSVNQRDFFSFSSFQICKSKVTVNVTRLKKLV